MSLATGEITLELASLTPEWLKANYLAGLTLCDETGVEYPDSFYETHLQNAVRKIEQVTNVSILEETLTGEQHDYRVGDYMQFAFLQLFKAPVRSVETLRAVYPLGQTIQEFPDEWIRLEAMHGQIHLVPSSGSIGNIIIGQGGAFLPLLYGGVTYMPSLWEVDYTVGFDPDDFPREVAEAIAKMACVDILSIASDLVRPIGVNSESVSIDGLSQSMSYQAPAFKQRIDRYLFDLYGIEGKSQEFKTTSGLLKQIHDYHFGFNLASLY
jgi:hypothetical protein